MGIAAIDLIVHRQGRQLAGIVQGRVKGALAKAVNEQSDIASAVGGRLRRRRRQRHRNRQPFQQKEELPERIDGSGSTGPRCF